MVALSLKKEAAKRGCCRDSKNKLEYESKRVSAETAAQVVRNGYRVHFGTGAGIVDTMDKALAMRVSELRDVTILSTVGIHEEPLATYRAAAALGEEGPRQLLVHADDVLRTAGALE